MVGATGYSGALAARLLADHPSFRLAFCTSDAASGQSVGTRLGVKSDLTFAPNGEAPRLGLEVDAVFLATPAEVSARLAPAFVEAGKVVVDFSGAFRLADAAAYPKWYAFSHPSPALLGLAHYGLPELFGAPPRTGSGRGVLVANPGCYPTSALLALAPLLRAGLVEARGVIIDAKSGVTGAGRQAKEEYSFAEIDDDLRAYRILAHQHTPEIVRHLGRVGGAASEGLTLTFTPHLLPVRRGLLSTCYARPRSGVTSAAVAECLAEAYRATPFVKAVAPERVTLNAVVGTNEARVGAVVGDDVVVAIGSIDNLLKGAAGQALQNLNLIFGLEETTGLSHLQRIAP